MPQSESERILIDLWNDAIISGKGSDWNKGRIAVAESAIAQMLRAVRIDAFENHVLPCDSCGENKQMATRTYIGDGKTSGYVCKDCFDQLTKDEKPEGGES